MSQLVYQGDSTKAFGEYLPKPCIESVVLDSHGWTGTIAVYFRKDSKSTDALNMESLLRDDLQSKIVFYIVVSEDRSFYEQFTTQEKPELITSEMRNSNKFPSGASRRGVHYRAITLDSFTRSEEAVYDESGHELVKFIAQHRETDFWDEDADGVFSEAEALLRPEDDPFMWDYWGVNSLIDDPDAAVGHPVDQNSGPRQFQAIYAFSAVRTGVFEYIVDEGGEMTYDGWPPAAAALTTASTSLTTRAQMSDVSYEMLYLNGKIPSEPEIVWVDPNNVIFSGTALQSISNQYFKPETYTYSQLYDAFKSLLDEYDYANAPQDLKNGIDEISYVIENFKDQVTLVPKLNQLRSTWVNRDPGSLEGHLYERFRRRLVNVNSTIIQQPPLSKQLIYNPKVSRAVHPIPAEWTPRWNSDGAALKEEYSSLSLAGIVAGDSFHEYYDAVYGDGTGAGHPSTSAYYPEEMDWDAMISETGSGRTPFHFLRTYHGGQILYPRIQMGNYAFTSEDAPDTTADMVLASGFFFVDLEKYIGTQSVLSNFYDPYKIQSFYGKEILHSTIMVGEVSITRQLADYAQIDIDGDGELESMEEYWEGTTEVEGPAWTGANHKDTATIMALYCPTDQRDYVAFSSPLTQFNILDEKRHDSAADDTEFLVEKINTKSFSTEGTEPTYTLNSSLALRNLRFPWDESFWPIPNYRLMCYEFHDIYSFGAYISPITRMYQYPPHDMYYKMVANIHDTSLKVVLALVGTYEEDLAAFLSYKDAAEEFCSFNSQTGVFNQFFVDWADSLYEEDPENTPWFRAPYAYFHHLDLLYDTYEGDEARILQAAQEMSSQISPAGGTLSGIQAFASLMQGLWDSVYDGIRDPTTFSDDNPTTSELSDIENRFAREVTRFSWRLPSTLDYATLGTYGYPHIERHTAYFGKLDASGEPYDGESGSKVDGNYLGSYGVVPPIWETNQYIERPNEPEPPDPPQPIEQDNTFTQYDTPYAIVHCNGEGNWTSIEKVNDYRDLRDFYLDKLERCAKVLRTVSDRVCWAVGQWNPPGSPQRAQAMGYTGTILRGHMIENLCRKLGWSGAWGDAGYWWDDEIKVDNSSFWTNAIDMHNCSYTDRKIAGGIWFSPCWFQPETTESYERYGLSMVETAGANMWAGWLVGCLVRGAMGNGIIKPGTASPANYYGDGLSYASTCNRINETLMDNDIFLSDRSEWRFVPEPWLSIGGSYPSTKIPADVDYSDFFPSSANRYCFAVGSDFWKHFSSLAATLARNTDDQYISQAQFVAHNAFLMEIGGEDFTFRQWDPTNRNRNADYREAYRTYTGTGWSMDHFQNNFVAVETETSIERTESAGSVSSEDKASWRAGSTSGIKSTV